MLHKLFQKIQEEITFANSFHEASVTVIPKPDKTGKEKILQISICHKYRLRIPKKS